MPRIKSNPLLYPVATPSGFFGQHIASGSLRFSAVASGANFRNIVRGNSGTQSGTLVSLNDGIIGPCCQFNGTTTEGVSFAGNPSGLTTTATVAAICRTGSSWGATYNFLFMVNGDSAYSIGANSGNGWIVRTGGADTFVSNGTIPPLNTPFFVVASVNGTAANFVAVNLLDGSIQSAAGLTVTAATGGDATYYIGTYNAGAFPWSTGSIAAVMHSGAALSMPQLLQWGRDPWAFWYPRPTRFAVGIAVAAGFIPYNPWPQAAPVLAQ